MSIKVLGGQKLPLNVALEGGETNRFIRAHVYNFAGIEITGSPFQLVHIGNGTYLNLDFTVNSNDIRYFATYKVYEDSNFTNIDENYGLTQDIFDVDVSYSNIEQGLMDLRLFLQSVIDIGVLVGIVNDEDNLIGIVEE